MQVLKDMARALKQSDRVLMIMYNYQEKLLARIRELEDEKANG